MKTLLDYIEKNLIEANVVETNAIEEAYSSEIKDKIELGDDLCAITFIKALINNWYYYVNAHNEGTTQQKFSPKVIYNFRNSLKNILSGKSEQNNIRMHNQKLKEFANNLYKTMYSITPKDFDKQMECLKDSVKELTAIDKELKSQNKEAII